MPNSQETVRRERFADSATTGQPLPIIAKAAAIARTGFGFEALAIAFCHAAFVAPEHTNAIYDALAAGWFGAELPPAIDRQVAIESPSREFWIAFWNVIEDTRAGHL